MAELRRSVKDSVFTYLFRQPEYTRQLYLALHPEDTDVTEEDCKIVTIENVLSTGLYNDLGVQVRDKLLLLVEAQSTFSVNIALRLLLYLADTYKAYTQEHKLDLYGSRPVTIPRPEMYVVYTGDKKDVPETLHLSDLYGGNGSVELDVTVLRGGEGSDILTQYVRFCKLADRNRKQYGNSPKAIEETIRQCLDENILAPFLVSRQKEVQDIMGLLFDDEVIREIHDYNVAKEARQEGRREGRQEGHQAGREEGISAMVSALQGLSIDRSTITQTLASQFSLLPQVAEEKVAQYWVQ